MYKSLNTLIIIILSIIVIVLTIIIFTKNRDCKKCPKKMVNECINESANPNIKGFINPKIIGGWIYPGSYNSEGWDPKNFSDLDYINIGSVYLKSPSEIVKTNIDKDTVRILIKNIQDQNINILISFDIQQDPIPGTSIRKQDAWNSIFENENNVTIVVDAIISMLDEYGSSGVNFDWEPIEKNTKNVTNNVTLLFKGLKSKTLKYTGKPPLIGIDMVPNTRNVYDFKGINPFLDYAEVMSYFSLNFPYDYNNYYSDISKEKIILGLGLSNYSYSGVNIGSNPNCPASTVVKNDWGGFCGSNNDQPCKLDGAFPSWKESWTDGPPLQYKYDFYLKKIRNGEAKYIYSQNGLGADKSVHIPYLYFNENSSVLPFNGFDRIQLYAEKVLNEGYGGIFTWITSSDSIDGIFTKKIYEYLAMYPYYNCGGEMANCDIERLAQQYGYSYIQNGKTIHSLGYVPPINDTPYNDRKNKVKNIFTLLRDGNSLDSTGTLCGKGTYGYNCEFKYCSDKDGKSWYDTQPNQVYSWSIANSMCGQGKTCNASTGTCDNI